MCRGGELKQAFTAFQRKALFFCLSAEASTTEDCTCSLPFFETSRRGSSDSRPETSGTRERTIAPPHLWEGAFGREALASWTRKALNIGREGRGEWLRLPETNNTKLSPPPPPFKSPETSATMQLTSLIPTRWRRNYDITDPNKPGSYNRRVTPWLQSLTHKASTHPVYTIAFVVMIGSGLYANLLATGFFQPSPAGSASKVDIAALSAGSRRVHLGPETGWKWALEENLNNAKAVGHDGEDELALVTLAFPESAKGVNNSPDAEPDLSSISSQDVFHVEQLPNSASPLSNEKTVAFSMAESAAARFLQRVMEIPAPGAIVADPDVSDDESETASWVMRSNNGYAKSTGIITWVKNSWASFVDLVEHAETLDIIIMSLGYFSMYLTFGSLFLSMKRMGSNFWLGTTVLFSSAFAFLFGLIVTLQLGVPENIVLLSEGVPFLVVTVGFEKPIVLTQAVLSASLQARANNNGNGDVPPLTIRNAVQTAVGERGFEIVRDYFIEIVILCIGAASGIQGGLRQFCFLAAWTLFFDCILLFTFYTSILTIKLEINRIKRHVALRRALEEDGMSRRVAENYASSNEWPKDDALAESAGWSLVGRKVKANSVPRFKLLMIGGFIAINVLNLCSMPFRGTHNNSPVTTAGLSSVVTPPPMDPFKVAGSGLDHLYAQAKKSKQALCVTVYNPVKYDLHYPAATSPPASNSDWSLFDGDYREGVFSAMGGRVVESLLKSFEDPVLSKWVIVVLAMSLELNGYLFNAARWSITPESESQPSSPVQQRARSPHDAKPTENGHAIAPAIHIDPASPKPTDGPSSPGRESRKRTREDCEAMLKDKRATELEDQELVELSLRGKIPGYALEKTLGDKTRAVKVRRGVVSRTSATAEFSHKLERSKLPYENFDYDRVHGACCENVIGYLPLPLGVAGPLTIDGKSYFLPMATTEGVLVASASRGCKAINAGGGAVTVLTGDGMTRGPCIGFETLSRAGAAKVWLDSAEGQRVMKDAFNSTSRFARLQQMKSSIAGTYVYVRFKTTTGDAMGMNMISKGVENALSVMKKEAGFEDMAIITVSGNFCTDKKPAAINWIDGRGKSVVAEAIIPEKVVKEVLKSDVNALVELNTSKNLIGSAMAGSIGGFNAHAANLVTAMFLATGQDPAQNVESSNCITVMKK